MQETIPCTQSQEGAAETWRGSNKPLSGEGPCPDISLWQVRRASHSRCLVSPELQMGPVILPRGHPTEARKPGQWPSDLSVNHRGTSSFFFFSPSLPVSCPPCPLVFKQIRTE